jgi:hypothetical protein
MVERVILEQEEQKKFLHECMIRFQLVFFAASEEEEKKVYKEAKDEQLRGKGKVSLPCFMISFPRRVSQVFFRLPLARSLLRNSTSNKSATLNCLINVSLS